MEELHFNFNVTSFNNIFPFYILIDKELRIKSAGKSIKKIIPELKKNNFFNDSFLISRPHIEKITLKNFNQILKQLCVIVSQNDNTISFRGQFEIHEDCFLFVGSPWFSSIEDMVEKNLTLHDFAFHDPLLDLLHILKNQDINNEELKKLLNTVNNQRKKLKKDKEDLNKLSLVASANKNGVIFTNPDGTIFWCNQAYTKLTGFTFDEISGKTPVEVGKCNASNRDEIRKMVDAFYRGEPFDVEIIHANKNGTSFWSKTNGQPILDSDGKVIQYFSILEDISIQKKAEENLLVLSSIVEKNILPVIICDSNGCIEWVNSSFIELTGYSNEELIGQKPGAMLQGPETNPETVTYLRNQIQNGLPFNCEIINYSKSRQKYWVHIQGQVLYNKNGEIIKFFAIEENITQQKEFSQQLIESQDRLTSLIANLQFGILLEDEDKKIVLVNSMLCSMFELDLTPDELKGYDCTNAGEETKHLYKNPEEFLSKVSKVVNEKEKLHVDEVELANGKILERNVIPIISGNEYKGRLWSYEDITIKKKYKESIEAQREKYSNIIANMNMGLLEVDKDDYIQLANQSFCEMSGFSLLDLLGNKASEMLLTYDSKKVVNNKNTERINGKSDSYEVTSKNKNGETRHWLISGAPNYNVNGEMIGSIGVHLDITNQKALELQKEQLLKKLEKQNDQLNEYAQIVSHDLKSPLRSIHSLISWIKEDNDKEFSEQTMQYLGMIENKVEKMDYLIQGILTYSKVDTDKVKEEEISLNEVLINIINTIHVPENIEIKIIQEFPTIKADKFRMQQLFQNLISNAVIYIDKPIGLVEVYYLEEKNDYIFAIKDNGTGIALENQEKIFKIFQSFTQHEKSTGIGLSIVKRIVDNYKGTIWIESELKKGTTFFIKLPKI